MAEVRALGRDLELIGRHWQRGAWQRYRRHGLARWQSLSPTTYRWLRRLRRRLGPAPAPEPVELPPWGSTVTVDGITTRIDERMSPFNVHKLMRGQHTRRVRGLLASVLEPDDVVMELGGGIGMVAISCAKTVGSERVFSYEANPRLESLIRDNYALNGVEPTLKMCMLGPDAGRRTFHVSERFSLSSMFDTERSDTAIEVPVEPFNAEIGRIRPTVLVSDIEGGEAELLDYADLSTVEKLVVEIHSDIFGALRANALRRRLRRMGFAETARSGRQYFLYVRRPRPRS